VGAVGRALADARRRIGGIFRAGDNGIPS
jgi:hypothetical protein